MAGRDVLHNDLEWLVDAIRDESRKNPVPNSLSNWIIEDQYPDGFYVGVSLGTLGDASGEGRITPLDALRLQPTDRQRAEVEAAVAQLPESVLESPDLLPLGTYLVPVRVR